MFILWCAFFVLNILQQTTLQIVAQNPTELSETDIMEILMEFLEYDECNKSAINICVSTCDCVDTDEDLIPISSWIILHEWLINCVNEYRNPERKEIFLRNEENTTKQPKTVGFVVMTSEEIYVLLEAIDTYKNITDEYLHIYENSVEYLNSSNTSQCYKHQNYNFVYKEAKNLDTMFESTWRVYVFQLYVEIPIVLVILLSGLIMTGTLLFIFLKHKELRSQQNMIVLNIAICDFLSLLMIYPTQYILFNGIYIKESFIEFYRIGVIALTSARALSILALGIQRLIAVTECLRDSCCGKMDKRFKITLFVSCVWGPSLIYIYLRYADFGEDINEIKTIVMTATAFFFVFTLPIVITVLNCTTACKLRRSAREMPGENTQDSHIQARYRSSRVINFLCFVFWVTHGPFLFATAFSLSYISSDDIFSIESKYSSCVFHGLYCLSGFFNSLALAIMSKTFKLLFIKYLCRRSAENQKLHVEKTNSTSRHSFREKFRPKHNNE